MCVSACAGLFGAWGLLLGLWYSVQPCAYASPCAFIVLDLCVCSVAGSWRSGVFWSCEFVPSHPPPPPCVQGLSGYYGYCWYRFSYLLIYLLLLLLFIYLFFFSLISTGPVASVWRVLLGGLASGARGWVAGCTGCLGVLPPWGVIAVAAPEPPPLWGTKPSFLRLGR